MSEQTISNIYKYVDSVVTHQKMNKECCSYTL